MLQAIIVDDEPLSVKRLTRILSENGEIEVCGTFLNPLEAYSFVKANPIDLAFLDVDMPEVNGMRFSGLLLDLDASIDVVFVTAYDDYAVQAFEMSALDYLMKPVTIQRMELTLNKIRRRRPGGPGPEPRRAAAASEAAEPLVEPLTSREAEILNALTDGLSNKEIAVRFRITEATVKTHVFRLYGKLGVNRRGQAIARARELKFIY